MTASQYATRLVLSNTMTKGFDGEASISSTLTVDFAPRKPLGHDVAHAPAEPSYVHKACKVNFDMASTVEHAGGVVYDDEEDLLWYNRKEYKTMKRSYLSLGKQFQKYDKENREPQAFKTLLSKAFHACLTCKSDPRGCLLETSDEKALQNWLRKGTRCGVERISMIMIFADRSSRRKKISAAVLEAQETTLERGFEDRSEHIRCVSEEISRPSRLFAWRIAS